MGISESYTNLITQRKRQPRKGQETMVSDKSGTLHQLSDSMRREARAQAATGLFAVVYDNININVRSAEQIIGRHGEYLDVINQSCSVKHHLPSCRFSRKWNMLNVNTTHRRKDWGSRPQRLPISVSWGTISSARRCPTHRKRVRCSVSQPHPRYPPHYSHLRWTNIQNLPVAPWETSAIHRRQNPCSEASSWSSPSSKLEHRWINNHWKCRGWWSHCQRTWPRFSSWSW